MLVLGLVGLSRRRKMNGTACSQKTTQRTTPAFLSSPKEESCKRKVYVHIVTYHLDPKCCKHCANGSVNAMHMAGFGSKRLQKQHT